MPDLDAHDLDAADAPFRGDAILVADPSAEGAAIVDALRMRGFLVVELAPEHLDARALAESPRAVVVDIDHVGAIEAVERLRELSVGAPPEMFFLGDPARAAELGATRASGRAHARPVDVDAVVEAVARIAQIGLEDDGYGTLPPPSFALQRPTLPPPEQTADPPEAPAAPPTSGDPFDVASMLDDDGGGVRMRATELSPELSQLLDAAEQRVLASGQHAGLHAFEEAELDLRLAPDLLALLDEPIDPEDDVGGTGSDLGTAAPPGAKRATTSGSAVLALSPTESELMLGAPTPSTGVAIPPAAVSNPTNVTSGRLPSEPAPDPFSSASRRVPSEPAPSPANGGSPLGSASRLPSEPAPAPGPLSAGRRLAPEPEPSRPPSSQEALPRSAPSSAALSWSSPSLAATSWSAASLAAASWSTPSVSAATGPRAPGSSLITGLPQTPPRGTSAPTPPQGAPPAPPSAPGSENEPSPPARGRRPASPLSPPSYPAVNIVSVAPPPPVASPPSMASPPSAASPLSGRLTDLASAVLLNAGDVVRALARAVAARTSGSIAIGPEAAVRRVVLRDGDLVTAASSADDETLVAFLAARGDLDRDAALRLGAKLPAFGRHAGAALIAHGYLGQDDLWPVLRAHAEWIIGRALLETTGSFELEAEPPGRLKAEPGVFGGATGAEVLVEAIRRVIPPEVALQRLGGPLARIDEGQRRTLLAECALRREEEEAIRLAPGRTLAEILTGAPPELADVLYALVSLGVLDALAPVSAPPAESVRGVDLLDQEAIRLRVKARMALVEDGDYFALLGIPRSATGYEIKRAYLELRRAFEPARVLTAQTADLVTEVKTIIEVLDEAYEILKEPTRRDRYRRAIEAGPP